MAYLGDFAEDSTVELFFTTNNSSGAAVEPDTAFAADDFDIFKRDDGGNATKATTNGITLTSTFNSTTGLHHLEIDTNIDTGDSGFWVAGADYFVVATPDNTVDSQTVAAVVGHFSIENRYDQAAEALTVTTHAEPGQEAPGATVSLATKIGYLYKAWRNRSTMSTTTYSLYADDATTVDQKATVSDSGTADKGEVGTGP